MNLTMRIITTIAALSGQPLRFSTVAAPDHDPDSTLLDPDASKQIKPRKGKAYKGIAYAGKLKLDILVPKGTGPLVLYLPGGGFVSARRAMAAKQRRYVADAGFVVASIDYRTTTAKATYRDGLADVAKALRFLRDHAAEYGIDGSRVGVWGESAGGYLASMAGTQPDNGIDAVVDVFGASNLAEVGNGFDAETAAAYTGPKSALSAYIVGKGRALADHPNEAREADPASRVTAKTPPFLLFHGEDDRLISPSQTARLHQALRAAGVESTRYVVKNAGHGELSDKPAVWTSEELMDLVVAFLREHLTGGR